MQTFEEVLTHFHSFLESATYQFQCNSLPHTTRTIYGIGK
jgi:hypothetical protein